MSPQTIDVREIPPPRRHPLIFQTHDQLQPGESFRQFTWEYLEQGLEIWRVRIGKPATQ